MRAPFVAILLAACIGLSAAHAADVPALRTTTAAAATRPLPFPRSERAAAVWNERACWSQCGAHTAWGLASCLQYDNQGHCVRLADRADRTCQRQCRTMGGPYVPDIFDALN